MYHAGNFHGVPQYALDDDERQRWQHQFARTVDTSGSAAIWHGLKAPCPLVNHARYSPPRFRAVVFLNVPGYVFEVIGGFR